jgi:uncharacterized protein
MWQRFMIADLFTKAVKAERVARTAMEDGSYDDAVSRAYYAMFNAMRCLLIDADPANAETSSHKGVLTKFHHVFIRTGKVDKRFGPAINRAQTARHVADYGHERLGRPEAEGHVDNAAEFLATARQICKSIAAVPQPKQSDRELQIEAAKEEAGRRSAVRMLLAAARGLRLSFDGRLAEDLVLYGTEEAIANMIEKLIAEPDARLDLQALARDVGIELPTNEP